MKGRMKGAHEGAQPAFSIFFQWLGVYLYATGDYFSYRKRMRHQCGDSHDTHTHAHTHMHTHTHCTQTGFCPNRGQTQLQTERQTLNEFSPEPQADPILTTLVVKFCRGRLILGVVKIVSWSERLVGYSGTLATAVGGVMTRQTRIGGVDSKKRQRTDMKRKKQARTRTEPTGGGPMHGRREPDPARRPCCRVF